MKPGRMQRKLCLTGARLSVAMAVMTQVNISRVRHAHLQKSYSTASSLSNVQHRILRQVRAETQADKTSQQLLIREEMNTLLSDAKADMAYADLQNAYANVYASLGINPVPAGSGLDASRSTWLQNSLRTCGRNAATRLNWWWRPPSRREEPP